MVANATLPVDNTVLNRVQHSVYDGGELIYPCNVSYVDNGMYHVVYTPTLVGRYNIRGRVFGPGGLYGTYLESADWTDNSIGPDGFINTRKSFERIDTEIDFLWVGNERPAGTPDEIGKDIGPDYFSVRWRGYVLAPFSEVFTFTVEADDGAKMYVNDLMILDGLGIGCASIDGTIALMKESMYPVVIEYQDLVGNGSIRLSWRSRSQKHELIPSHAFFSSSTSFFLSNSNNTLFVNPARLCAATSTAFGPQLSILTAGAQASFSIQVLPSSCYSLETLSCNCCIAAICLRDLLHMHAGARRVWEQ